MPRHIKIGMLFLVLLTLAGVSYYYNLQKRIADLVRSSEVNSETFLAARSVIPDSAPIKNVVLYFPSAIDDGRLVTEVRQIRSSPLPSEEAKQIVVELIAGPNGNFLKALPSQTRLRELFVTADGLAAVDLTREASLNHPGGLERELASIYSVVNSLTENVSGIDRVQLLIEGDEVETLAGHIELSYPLKPNLSITSPSGVPMDGASPP